MLRADSGFYSRNVADACTKADVAFSITAKLHKGGVHHAIAAIDETAWIPIPYFLDGADVAETTYRPFGRPTELRLIVRRVRPTPGSQLALFAKYSYHAFITNRPGETLALEADHRRHAEIENTIRDLKYGAGLNHLPSGRFGANAAWLALNVIAHNLARWTSRIGFGETLITTETLRRRHLATPGRLTQLGPPRHPAPTPALALGRQLQLLPGQPPLRRRGHLNPPAPSDAAHSPGRIAEHHEPTNQPGSPRADSSPAQPPSPHHGLQHPSPASPSPTTNGQSQSVDPG